MIINKNYETELNIRDILFSILYKWRIVLLFGLIIAGVLGFKEYWSFEKYHRIGELTPAEKQYEANVEANQKSLEQAEKTLAEYESIAQDGNNARGISILMGINPTNIWVAEKKYYVDASVKTLASLGEAFSISIDEDKLTDVFGTSARKDYYEVAFICIDKDLNILSVVGCGATEEEASLRKEFVDSYFKAANEKLSKNEEYTLEVLSDSVGERTVLIGRNANGEKEEKDLAEIQKKLNNNYQAYQNQIASYRNTRNELMAKTFTKPVPKTISQAIFGFIIGAMVAIVILLVYYLSCGKMKTAREIRNRYDLSLLGEFDHSRAWWKGKGIDWIIEKMEFGKKTNWDNELESIAFLIDEAEDGKTILLTGTLEEKRLKRIHDGLAPKLHEKGIELAFEPDYLHNSEAVAASRDLDSVLLVEEKYHSRIRDLNRMVEMLTIEDANVIGAILI